MATDLWLARDWIFEVESATPATWIEIDGINSFELNPSENEETADDTLFRSQGMYEGQVTQRGATLELKGKRVAAAAVIDPGQARVEVLGVAVGNASIGAIRFRHTVQTSWTVWACTVSLGPVGGGQNDKTSWEVTFSRNGAATTAAVV